jgi:hypothetical protein|nr:MAG TPA: hypothetical protein [Caudoviricetes sp.]
MRSKIDRTGEIGYNNFGSKMVITKYKTNNNVDVYFPEYNWIFKNVQYGNFKNGNIKCPYEKRVYGIGYIGEGKYKVKINGKKTKCYDVWHSMLERCYNEKYTYRNSTYKECEVCEKWHNYTNFGDWFEENYYTIENETMCLDKDILNKGNKIYSPDNCIFAPERINLLFVKSKKSRGNYPIGVSYHKASGKFEAHCSVYNYKENKKKLIYLGLYDTTEEAFNAYKQYKEKNIKDVADYYKEQIPSELYQALYKYEVNIND